MGKLSGVQTIDMVNGEITKVSYGGAEYAVVPTSEQGKAVIGDLVLITDNTWCDATKDEFYKCVELSSINPRIVDNVGDKDSNFYDGSYELFRKISAQETPVNYDSLNAKVDGLAGRVTTLEGGKQAPKTEKRHAKVGERILITDAKPHYKQSYKLGDILTVTKADAFCKGDVQVLCQVNIIDYNEYEVIVDQPKSPTQSITHNGADYTLVERKAQAGDVVVFTESDKPYIKNGKTYEVCPTIRFKDEDGMRLPIYHSDRRTTNNVLVYTPKPRPIVEGDIVVITANTNKSRNKVGDIGKVGKKSGWGGSSYVNVFERPYTPSANGNSTRPSEMRHATASEIAEYERAVAEANKPKFNVGDYAKVVGQFTSYNSTHKEGTFVKISKVDGSNVPYCATDLDGKEPRWFTPEDLRKATDVEIAEAVAQAKKDALFTEVGRKPNEYKKGDIIGYDSIKYGKMVIREVTGVNGDFVKYYSEGFGEDSAPKDSSRLSLIATVESRLDTK